MNKKKLIDNLNKLDPKKPYGPKLFNALARLTVSVAIECVALQIENQTTEILLTRRAKNDLLYPWYWHFPGTILRPGEKLTDAFERLAKKEFRTPLKPKKDFIAFCNIPNCERGHELSLLFRVYLEKNPKGQWFSIYDLPKKIVPYHKNELITIIQYFLASI